MACVGNHPVNNMSASHSANGEAAVSVQRLDSGHVRQWDSFVQGHPEATFFHLAAWKSVIEKSFGHPGYYLYTEQEGRITGVLPLVHVSSLLFGNALISVPFCVYGGILATDPASGEALRAAACELSEELRVDYLELRNRQPSQSGWPTKSLYVTFRKEIDPDPEVNLKNIPRKQRAMVRKGIDAGLEAGFDEDTGDFYDIYSESVHGLGTPVFSRKYFRILKEVFGPDCEILSVKKDGRVLASVMSFYFRNEILPYYGGGNADARRYKGYDFMYWEVMRQACSKDITLFDYGRSKEGTGSYRFKKHWGFVPEPLHYEYYLVRAKEVPDISPANPKYRLFIDVWKRMPLSMSRILGPLLSRYLG